MLSKRTQYEYDRVLNNYNLNSPVDIKAKLNMIMTVPKKKLHLTALANYLKRAKPHSEIYKYVKNKLHKTNKIYATILKNQIPRDDWIQWGAIISNRDKYLKTKPSLSEIAIAYIYTEIPPRRVESMWRLRLSESKTENHITKNNLVLIKHKNSPKFGTNIVKLPSIVTTVIEQMRKDGYVYLASFEDKKHMSLKTFRRVLRKVFGTSPANLRSSFITYIYKQNFNYTEKEQIAKLMGHNVSVQHLHYLKIKK